MNNPVRGAGSARLREGGNRLAAAVQRGRWFIIAGWLAFAVVGSLVLPAVASGSSGGPLSLLPANSKALAAEQHALDAFSVPVVSTTSVVIHRDGGLPPLVQADAVLWALTFDQRLQNLHGEYPRDRILGALPLSNGLPILPGRHVTTVVTYLYFTTDTSGSTQTRLARDYAGHFAGLAGVQTYVTGVSPATVATGQYLKTSLPRLTLATLALVALIVGLTFRSVVAPFITLGVSILAYLVDMRVLGVIGRAAGLSLPSELDPIIVALILGVVTDYSVLFMAGERDALGAGYDRSEATRRSLLENLPIVLTAGLTVAAGTAALQVAPAELFRSFGPGLAISVVVALAVSATLLPALMAVLGQWLFWPSPPQSLAREAAQQPGGVRTARWLRLVTERPTAIVAVAACLLVLGVSSLPLRHSNIGLSFAEALPKSDPVQVGMRVAAQGFAGGITAPTELVVNGRQLPQRRVALDRFEDALRKEHGVAIVLGAAEDPVPGAHGLFFSDDGHAARVFVIFRSAPLSATAIANVRALQGHAGALLERAGLRDATVQVTGQTAIASEAARGVNHNLEIILLTAFGIELLLLGLYLRALVTPILLLLASALVVGSSVGLGWLLFGGGHGLFFYAPFSVAVLLVALGSDYNVFTVGAIWREAASQPLVPAVRTALPRTAHAITTAGFTLAGSFALLAIVPLEPFRQIAFMMGIGLLIDTFLVRAVFTPSVIALLGPLARWPSRASRKGPALAGTDQGRSRPTVSLTKSPDRGTKTRPAGTSDRIGAPKRRRRRRRALQVLIGAVLLGLLLWGADGLSRVGAQSVVEQTVKRDQRLRNTPDVNVHGAFFLPQVVAGSYSHISIAIRGFRDKGLRVDRVTADLYGVHVSLGPLVTGDVAGIPIDRSDEHVTIRYDDLNNYLASRGDPITVSQGPKSSLKITGHVSVFGRSFGVSADAKFTIADDGVHVVPTQLDTGNSVLDAITRATVGERLSFVIPTKPLPFGQHVTTVTFGPSAVQISATGSTFVVSPPAGSTS